VAKKQYFEEKITKIDIPVAPPDCHCLGMRWEGNIYIGTRFPFGLRSALKIFNAITDACNASEGVTILTNSFISCDVFGISWLHI